MRIYEGFNLEAFKRFVSDNFPVEVLPLNKQLNPWMLFAYRRMEYEDNQETGSYEYGHVYRNNKGRYSLVGLAENDYEEFIS